ncbi:ABC transporter ATP-binding protein, partial [Streptomyces flaveolus]
AGLPGDPPNPAALGRGCPFAARCPDVYDVCGSTPVQLWPAGPGRQSACLRVLPGFPNVSPSPDVPEPSAEGARS